MVRKKSIALYVFLACAFSWPLALFVYFLKDSLGSVFTTLILVLYMFGPALAAIIVQKFYNREALLEPLGLKIRWSPWYLAAWLAPVLIALAALGFSTLMPGVTYSPGAEGMMAKYAETLSPEQLEAMRGQMEALPVSLLLISLLSALVAGPTVNLAAAFGEELGWRGFLFKELQPLNFWLLSLITGLVWGLWHWPIIIQGHNYPQHPGLGIILMTLWTILLSPLMNLLRHKTGSTWSAALYHGSLNAVAGLPIMLTMGGNDLTVGVTGIPGFAILALVNLGIWFYLRQKPHQALAGPGSVEVADPHETTFQHP